tara:strand:+ start:770 stop:2149 length:1380 start_codon:yes stop_codon:yes gene_type:complete
MQMLKHISGIIIVTFLIGTFYITDRTPYSDEYLYLGHAHSLYSHGIFGRVDKKTGHSEPDAFPAPLYPALLAGFMLIDKDFANSTACYLTSIDVKKHNCSNKLFKAKIFQLILFALCLSYIWLLLVKITDSRLLAYITVGLLLFSGTPFYYADHFLTESLYLPLVFIFLLTLPIAILQQNLKYAVISAIFLALAALARPIFLYLFYMLLLIFPVMFFFKKRFFLDVRGFINFNLVFLITFSLIVGPWITRNMMHFDKFAITADYSWRTLSTRVAHNDMNNMEYLAGWIYWLPDFGDSLAKNLFGSENTDRLSFSDPQSFYPAGRHKVDQRINTAMNLGTGTNRYSSRMEALLKIYVYPDMLNHAKVTLLLAWRGFFVEKYFGLIGLFFLIWAIAGGMKDQYARYFHIIIIPPMILLFLQAAISLSIPRYNSILLLPLSIAITFGLMTIINNIRNWKTDR